MTEDLYTGDLHIPERVLQVLEWPAIQERLASLCATGPGKSFAQALRPLDARSIEQQLSKISAMKELIFQKEAPDFTGLFDLTAPVTRADKGGLLSPEELAGIRDFVAAGRRVKKYFKEHREAFPALDEQYRAIVPLDELGDLLVSSLTARNELNDSFSPALKAVKEKIYSVKKEIERTLHRMMTRPDLDQVLQEKVFSMRNDRYVVLVKAGMKGKIRGTLHDVSSSGMTLYIEPDAIADLNNSAVMLDKQLQAETAAVLRTLTDRVASHGSELYANLASLSYCDFLTAAARFSEIIKGNSQVVTDEPVMVLYRARHPLIQIMDPENIVANDIELGTKFRGLVISGANTGGKTVLLKTIGLCAVMTLFGLHIPAGPDSRIGRFTTVLADIGDDQNLSQSLSTFSGQVMVITDMLHRADGKSLVIIDEIMVGTNPRQGAALAQAILESLINSGCLLIVTTHYPELKELAALDERFENASVSFDLETLRPTFRLKAGLPGVSYALEIAGNYGMDAAIIGRSRALLDSRDISVEALIEKIQEHQKKMDQEQDGLREEKSGIAAMKDELLRREEELERKTARLKHQKGIEFIEELHRLRDEVSSHMKGLRQSDMKESGRMLDELSSAEAGITRGLHEAGEERFTDAYRKARDNEPIAGDTVLVVALEKEGVVEEVDHACGRATVLLGGNIRTQIKLRDVMVPKTRRQQKKSTAPAVKLPREEKIIPLTIQTQYNTIDLRGKRVDEALRTLEHDLDSMSRMGLTSAVIIHGHGTGALKEAVRGLLRTSPYADDFRPGDYGEGGDGVTIVLLR